MGVAVKKIATVQIRGTPDDAERLIREVADAMGLTVSDAPKDRMVIVCCGCGAQVDLPAISVLVQAETTPQQIVYSATCPACGYTHRIRVSQ